MNIKDVMILLQKMLWVYRIMFLQGDKTEFQEVGYRYVIPYSCKHDYVVWTGLVVHMAMILSMQSILK